MIPLFSRPFGLFFLIMLAGCSLIRDEHLEQEILEFNQSVFMLAAVIKEDFAMAEKLNSIAFLNNLQFQLMLGGTPDTKLKPLFKGTEIAARQKLLTAITRYAHIMEAIATGNPDTSTFSSLSNLVEDMKGLDYHQFNLTHSLSVDDSKYLVSNISIFDALFIMPERDKKLYSIVQKGNAALKHAATLLFVDIGEVQDQSSQCSFTAPNKSNLVIAQLKLCRGGLRSIARSAINSDIDTWSTRLAFSRKSSLPDQTAEQAILIKSLVQAQSAVEVMDQAMVSTQNALISMLKAHQKITNTLDPNISLQRMESRIISSTKAFLQTTVLASTAVKKSAALVAKMQASFSQLSEVQPKSGDGK